MKKLFVVFLVVLFALMATVVSAEKADKPKGEEGKAGASTDANAVKAVAPVHLKIAFLPFEVEGARDGTKTMIPELHRSIFETTGFDVTMGVLIEQAMQRLNIRPTGIPTAKELLDIGQELGMDYVLFAQLKFSTKKVWVTLLPRARSELTLNPMIVSVKAREVVYSPKDKIGYVRGGSKYQTGVGLVINYPVALFMGGNLGKVERATAEQTIRSAYTDFFDSLVQGKKIKIE